MCASTFTKKCGLGSLHGHNVLSFRPYFVAVSLEHSSDNRRSSPLLQQQRMLFRRRLILICEAKLPGRSMSEQYLQSNAQSRAVPPISPADPLMSLRERSRGPRPTPNSSHHHGIRLSVAAQSIAADTRKRTLQRPCASCCVVVMWQETRTPNTSCTP